MIYIFIITYITMLTSLLTPAVKIGEPAMPEQLIKTKRAVRALNGAHMEFTGHFQCTPHICDSCSLIGLPPHRVYECYTML